MEGYEVIVLIYLKAYFYCPNFSKRLIVQSSQDKVRGLVLNLQHAPSLLCFFLIFGVNIDLIVVNLKMYLMDKTIIYEENQLLLNIVESFVVLIQRYSGLYIVSPLDYFVVSENFYFSPFIHSSNFVRIVIRIF